MGFSVSGMKELEDAFLRVGYVPDDVKVEVVTAMANVALEAQKSSIRQFGIYDAENTGEHAVDRVSLSKAKVTESGVEIFVTFKGTREDKSHKKKTRNAEIIFVNEYGKRGVPARPAVRLANATCKDEAIAAGQEVFEKWLEKTY